MATEIEATATVTGTYTVIVTTNDSGWNATGDYLLTLARVPAAFSTSLGDEGGAMTNGGNHAGTIHVGDLDMWSFTATAGEALAVSIGEVGPDVDASAVDSAEEPDGSEPGDDFGRHGDATERHGDGHGHVHRHRDDERLRLGRDGQLHPHDREHAQARSSCPWATTAER